MSNVGKAIQANGPTIDCRGLKSTAEIVAELSPEAKSELFKDYTPEQIDQLNSDWDFWGRPKQQIPPGKWFIWLILAGRGFGKTRTGAEATIRKQNPTKQTDCAATIKGASRIALIGQTTADVRDVMLTGESGIITCAPSYNKPRYIASRRVVEWPNGAVAYLYSGDEPDQLRGPQHEFGWVDELVKFQAMQEAWDNFELGLRLGSIPQAIVTTTPQPKALLKELIKDPDVYLTKGSSYENMSNLATSFIKRVIKKYEGTRLGRQELHADILGDVLGALWKTETLDMYRVTEAPSLKRIYVALDPAVTNKDRSDETGIVIAGLGENGHIYVLGDESEKLTSDAWARKAILLMHKYRANKIVAEVNNGGDLVSTVINLIDPYTTVEKVFASRDKYTRAEPVAALYEQGKVHHVGVFPQLEEELTEWVPGEKSPNRLDACVWACTKLGGIDEDESGIIVPVGRFVA
jgi:phage terminase large subunit-like protein